MYFRLLPVILTCIALQIGACSSAGRWESPPADVVPSPAVHGDGAAGEAAEIAMSMIGVPYRYGGATPNGFDCSGLVYYSYGQAGLRLPRTSAAQYRHSRPLSLEEARPGDLLFFSFEKKISHVGIYLGSDSFVHSPTRGRTVEIGSLSQPYYKEHFVAAGRVD